MRKRRILNSARKLLFYACPWLYAYSIISWLVRREPSGTVLLDAGCGTAYLGHLLAVQRGFKYIGIDIFAPSLVSAKQQFPEGGVFILGKVQSLPIADKSVGFSCCVNVLEHLEHEEGYALLKELDRVTQRRIILWLPIGWWEQNEELDENPWSIHRSGWTESELSSFRIYNQSAHSLA